MIFLMDKLSIVYLALPKTCRASSPQRVSDVKNNRMVESDDLLQVFAATLDGLGVALCAFDGEVKTRLRNRSFLAFFPEQAGRVFGGRARCQQPAADLPGPPGRRRRVGQP
jgi:hypothetical protein